MLEVVPESSQTDDDGGSSVVNEAVRDGAQQTAWATPLPWPALVQRW